jgi:hypothetical protein
MEKPNNQSKLLVQLGVKKTDIKIVTFSKIQYNPFFIVNVTAGTFGELIKRTYVPTTLSKINYSLYFNLLEK